MRFTLRIVGILVASIATFYFIFWMPIWFLLPFRAAPAARTMGGLLCASLVATFMWRRRHGGLFPEGLVGSVLVGALSTGAVGFLAGFIGPMIFAPGANQGPLLGIFISGPLGVLLGGVGGGLYWAWRRRRTVNGPALG
jgi:hypothetical protein